jgi:LysM repeat protein
VAAPTPRPAPTPATYTVQAGDTLESVAAQLGVDQGALWFANRDQVEAGELRPGTQLSVPSYRGFLYQVQPGDTWDSIGSTFHLPPAMLAQLNELSPTVPPAAGSLVFVPRPV